MTTWNEVRLVAQGKHGLGRYFPANTDPAVTRPGRQNIRSPVNGTQEKIAGPALQYK
jgi:hypothetical protein